MGQPGVVILFASEGRAYNEWVKSLARRLEADGVEARIVSLSYSASKALEEAVGTADRVLVLCSPACRRLSHRAPWAKSIARLDHQEPIPVLTMGAWEQASPAFLRHTEYFDLSRREVFEEQYGTLVRCIAGSRQPSKRLAEPTSLSPAGAAGPPPPKVDRGEDALHTKMVVVVPTTSDVDRRKRLDQQELARFSERLRELRTAPEERLLKLRPAPLGPPKRRRQSSPKKSRGARTPEPRSKKYAPPQVDDVHVTTVTPRAIKPGARFLLEVVFHVEGFEVEAGEGRTVEESATSLPLSAGAALTVRLVEPDDHVFTIDDAEARLVWAPPSQRVDFRLRASEKARPGTYDLRVEYWFEGVQLTRSYLEIVIDRSLANPQPSINQHRFPRSAFASYSRIDKAIVAHRVDSLKTVGIDIFLDCLDIQQGSNWQGVLERELLGREALLLFWSTAARASEWVDKEWRFALERRGLDAILPNALEPPSICPPPPELATLQFGSVLTELARHWATEASQGG